MAKITINGDVVKVKSGTTILNAARSIGVDIPTLCFLEEINEIGFCRLCVVEVEGEQDLVSACNTEITNGMVIHTDSDKVIKSREVSLQLLASRHRFDCWRCPKDGACEFYDLLKQYDVVFEEFGPGIGRGTDLIAGSGISQDQSKCVLCKRCVAVCQNVVTANVLKFRDDDGLAPFVSPTPGLAFDEAGCIFCGQCVKTCPTGTLFETDHSSQALSFLRDNNNHVVVQLDLEANSAIAEEFGYDINTPTEETIGKTYRALELLGFDTVTNTNLGEDFHSVLTAQELVRRVNESETLPLFTASCPAATRYFELYKPEVLDHIAPVKSPHILQGSLLKKDLLKNEKNVKVVTVAPCTAKKYETTREELTTDGVKDVDASLTVRELVKMLKQKGINYKKLEPASPHKDSTTDVPTVQGGTLVSVLNAASELIDGKPLDTISFKRTRGELESDGIIEEATIMLGGKKWNVARVMGGAAFNEMFAKIEKKQYQLIEWLMCPGGCLNGGGMPIRKNITAHETIIRREEALCNNESDLPLSNPMHNDLVNSLLGEDSLETFQTTYSQKEFVKE
jgi:NADP-reducing hydrogenase subunit HndD